MRRLIGLLMILALVFPPLLGAAGIVTAAQIAGKLQTTVTTRVDHINTKLHQVETTIDTVSDRFATLKNVADQIDSGATTTAQTVVNTINNFKIHYAGLQWPAGIPLPSIPPVDLDVPGLSSVRDFLQNLYNSLASLSQAISDISMIDQVPGQIGDAVTETQGLYDDVNNTIAPYTTTLLLIGAGLVVWMTMMYVVLVYRWLGQGWAMLLGRPVSVKENGALAAPR